MNGVQTAVWYHAGGVRSTSRQGATRLSAPRMAAGSAYGP